MLSQVGTVSSLMFSQVGTVSSLMFSQVGTVSSLMFSQVGTVSSLMFSQVGTVSPLMFSQVGTVLVSVLFMYILINHLKTCTVISYLNNEAISKQDPFCCKRCRSNSS